MAEEALGTLAGGPACGLGQSTTKTVSQESQTAHLGHEPEEPTFLL